MREEGEEGEGKEGEGKGKGKGVVVVLLFFVFILSRIRGGMGGVDVSVCPLSRPFFWFLVV